jgi:hypothetical protein
MDKQKAAERARAYRDRKRRHEQGDHSKCVVGRCVVITPESMTSRVMHDEPVTALDGPEGLGGRGSRLWVEMTVSWEPSPLHREMLLEACRMADRLDRLDRQLAGEDWLRFWARNDLGTEVTVFVDKALTEARELQSAFRMAVTDLVKAAGSAKPERRGGGKLASVTALLDAKRPSTG